MGGYSSGSDDYSRKAKKKKRRRSRTRSRSNSSEESSRNRRSKQKSKKAKKSKHRRRSRSNSRGRDRRSRSRDRRSRSRDRRSRSRDRRSRSRDWRSRSRDRRSRSRGRRSRSRDRRSRSRERGARSRGRYSRSRSRSHSRSRSQDRSRRSRSRSKDRYKHSDQQTSKGKELRDACTNYPGFSDMTPAQQSEVRMRMALKAAAAADEKLKEQGLLPHGVGRTADTVTTVQEQQQRAKNIEDIEAEGFNPTRFKSSRGQEASGSKLAVGSHPMTDVNHEAAMFGFKGVPTQKKGIKYKETDDFLHHSLYVNKEEKMDRWLQKLAEFRKQKLEGEAMS